MGELKIANKSTKKGQALLDLPFIKKLKGIKNIEVVIACVLGAIILLIYFSSFTSGGQEFNSEIDYTTSSKYVSELELKLKRTLSKVSGAGEVDVMITLESGPEIVIATSTDQKTNTSQNGDNTTESVTIVENPIIVSQNGTSKPLVLMEILPKVKGVIVVAKGANDVRVKLDLLKAIQALLEVSNSNIQIFTGN